MFLKKEKDYYILDGKKLTKKQLIKTLKEFKIGKSKNAKIER